nr:hypothetical protein Iba_chr02bCG11660 [Ipomoea batatas]
MPSRNTPLNPLSSISSSSYFFPKIILQLMSALKETTLALKSTAPRAAAPFLIDSIRRLSSSLLISRNELILRLLSSCKSAILRSRLAEEVDGRRSAAEVLRRRLTEGRDPPKSPAAPHRTAPLFLAALCFVRSPATVDERRVDAAAICSARKGEGKTEESIPAATTHRRRRLLASPETEADVASREKENGEEIAVARGSLLMVDWRCSAINEKKRESYESTYHENPREAFERMMKSFDDIEDSHFKLKEENAQLLAERQDLEDLRSKNAEMLESISQLEKQIAPVLVVEGSDAASGDSDPLGKESGVPGEDSGLLVDDVLFVVVAGVSLGDSGLGVE